MADRDTQFAGFAQAIYDEMTMNVILSENRHDADVLRQEQLRIMARRAYDLVEHTINHAPVDEFEGDKGFDARDIPDMSQWPEEQSTHDDTPQS